MRLTSLPIACLSLCLFGSGTPGFAQEASPAGTKTFGAWTGTCNNLGACVAIGTAEAEAFFYVRIARDAGAAAAPLVKLVLVSQEPPKGPSPTFVLTAANGGTSRAVGSFPARLSPDDESQVASILAPPEASLAFIDATRDADTLDYAIVQAKGTLDLKGLSATLRWIDAQQGRAGTPTALVAKGMTPVGQVPEPRRPPEIIAAPSGSVTEIAKAVPPQAVLDRAAALPDCEKETVQAHETAEVWRLRPDLNLVSVPCTNGAYNFVVALYLTDAGGGAVRPVSLPKPAKGDGGLAENLLVNMSFDPATMILAAFDKGRGIGDCGEARSWIWTGTAFVLFEASKLDACPGALSDDWPSTYSAVRR